MIVYEIMDLRKVPADNPKAWVAQLKDVCTGRLFSLVQEENLPWKYTFPSHLLEEEPPSQMTTWLKEAIDRITRKEN